MQAPRWTALIEYRHTTHIEIVTHELEELSELHSLVEHGPHWDTIVKIEIVRNEPSSLTVEQAETLT